MATTARQTPLPLHRTPLSTLDRELLKPSASVALHKHSNALVDVLPPEADSSISMLGADEKPDVSYADIGGEYMLFN